MLEKDYKGIYYHHKLSWSSNQWRGGNFVKTKPYIWKWPTCIFSRQNSKKVIACDCQFGRRTKKGDYWRIQRTKYEDIGNNEIQDIVSLYQRKDLFDYYGNHLDHSKRLEYLEGLVKLARKRNLDVEVHRNQVATVHPTHAIRRVSVNRAQCNKTLHLTVEINQALIKGLMDTGLLC
jgi:hypothetical protein